MVEDKVAEILHNFYESYPYMTNYKLAEILEKFNEIKEEVYSRSRETLTKYNLPAVTVREDLINRRDLSSNHVDELNEVLFDRDYVKELVSHIQKLLGMKHTSNRVIKVTLDKDCNKRVEE